MNLVKNLFDKKNAWAKNLILKENCLKLIFSQKFSWQVMPHAFRHHRIPLTVNDTNIEYLIFSIFYLRHNIVCLLRTLFPGTNFF